MDTNFYNYETGTIIEQFAGHPEGSQFDIDDNGAVLLVFFNRPRPDEVREFSAGKPFEIRFVELNDIIMITAKIGSLNWLDAPYTPHLSIHMSEVPQIKTGEGLGLALQLMLIDSSTGQIMHQRLLGLSERFSKNLLDTVEEVKLHPFDKNGYNRNLQRLYNTYPTKDIVRMSKDYCKFK